MKNRCITMVVIFIFLGGTIFTPYAYAKRRPSVSSEKQEEEVEEPTGEELTGEKLREYLFRDVKIEEKKQEEDEEEETGFSAWTPTNAMLRSLMLPGWGQFFNEQYTKGYIFAGTEVVLLGTALIFYNQADSTYNDYKNGNASYDDYSKKVDTTNMVIGVFAAVWIYNVIDAYINAFEPEEESFLRKDGFALKIQNTDEVSLLYRKRF